MTFAVQQVIQEFSSAGGAETVAFELEAAFRTIGVRSSVLTSRVADAPPETDIRFVAPWLARMPTRGKWRYVGRLLVVPLFTIAATIAVRRSKDRPVIISHGDLMTGDVVVIHAIDLASVREKARSGNYRWMLNPMHWWVRARDRWMIGGLRYRCYVAVSKRVADDLSSIYAVPRERIRVIPNGINHAKFMADGEGRVAVRAEFGIGADLRVLLFVGHEFDRKGLRFAIEALPKLDPSIWLLVVGSDDRDKFVRLAESLSVADRVVFAGHRSDLPRFYRAADAFVLPTAYETFSLVCMEALASGVPILATAVGGIEDYLEDGVNGSIIERDGTSIANAATKLFASPDHYTMMRTAALKTAEGFAWTAIGKKYEALAREIADQPALAMTGAMTRAVVH